MMFCRCTVQVFFVLSDAQYCWSPFRSCGSDSRTALDHCSCQAETKLKDITGRPHDDLAALIACANAAVKWQKANILKETTPELQKAYQDLVAEGHNIDREAKQLFTYKIATYMAAEGKWEEWAQVLSLTGDSKNGCLHQRPLLR